MDVVILVLQNDLTGMEHNVFVPIAKGGPNAIEKIGLAKKKIQKYEFNAYYYVKGICLKLSISEMVGWSDQLMLLYPEI